MQTGYSERDGIYFEEMGSGRPILLIHGFGGNTYSWRHQMEVLSENFRVIAVDLRGFGHSPKPTDGGFSFADHVEVIKQFILEMELTDLILAGHSFGGAIALGTVLDFMDEDRKLIRGLIILAGAAYPQHLRSLGRLMREADFPNLHLMSLSVRQITRWLLKKMVHNTFKIPPDMVAAYAEPLKDPDARDAFSKTAAGMLPLRPETHVKRYRKIGLPALIIWGEKDTIVPLRYGRRLAKDLNYGRLEVLPKCGHLPQEEKPGEVNRLILDFLES